jgi:hypothetical protein
MLRASSTTEHNRSIKQMTGALRIRARAIAHLGIPIMPEDGHTQVMATKRRP